MGVTKRLRLSRWVSDSAEVGCGWMRREVTAAVLFCRDSFSRAELFRPGAARRKLGFDARDLSFTVLRWGVFWLFGV